MLIASLFLIYSLLYNQESWRWLTTSDGLSSNSINTILQTKNGHIGLVLKRSQPLRRVFEGFRSLNGPLNIIFESSTGQLFARLDMPDSTIGSNVFATSSLHLFDGLEWKDLDLLDNVSKLPQFAVESGAKL